VETVAHYLTRFCASLTVHPIMTVETLCVCHLHVVFPVVYLLGVAGIKCILFLLSYYYCKLLTWFWKLMNVYISTFCMASHVDWGLSLQKFWEWNIHLRFEVVLLVSCFVQLKWKILIIARLRIRQKDICGRDDGMVFGRMRKVLIVLRQ